jgi:hypothetical protein
MALANELRIGSYVDLYGSTAQVTRYDFSPDKPNGLAVDHGKPIPLNTEWLERFGASLHPWGWVLCEILIRWNMRDKFWIELGNGKRIDLPYVHTLQNFFALTGNELN